MKAPGKKQSRDSPPSAPRDKLVTELATAESDLQRIKAQRTAAVDFDKSAWMDDVRAFVQTSRRLGQPVAIERSRSGNGAHVWFFWLRDGSAGH